METIKVKAQHESQGEFVIINKADFVEGEHELFTEATESDSQAKAAAPKRGKKAATESDPQA
jgi:hypothetical protein